VRGEAPGRLLAGLSSTRKTQLMKRILASLLALLLIPIPSPAKPNWKLVGRITLYAGAVAADAFAAKGGVDCRRRNGPEPCTEKYGEFKGFEITRAVTTGVMIGISEWGHHEQFKEWFVPAAGFGAFNFAWGLHEERIHSFHRDKDKDRGEWLTKTH